MRAIDAILTWLLLLVLGCSSNGSAEQPSQGTDASTQSAGDGGPGPDGTSPQDARAAALDASGDGADPSVLFIDTAAIGDMTIDTTSLYWTAGGTRIMRMSLSGGTPVAIVAAPQISGASIGNIAVDASNVYWDEAQPTFGSPGGVFAAPLADGAG